MNRYTCFYVFLIISLIILLAMAIYFYPEAWGSYNYKLTQKVKSLECRVYELETAKKVEEK